MPISRDKGETKKEFVARKRRMTKYGTKRNPSMKKPKLGKWIQAKRVRVVKNSAGDKVLEIQRTVKKTIRRKRR